MESFAVMCMDCQPLQQRLTINHSYQSEKKNLSDMSPRIRHMKMALQHCNFELIYTPGKHIVLADALSPAQALSSDMPVSSTANDVETQINIVTVSLPASDVMLQQIAQATAKDPLLQKVSQHIQNGWPKGVCPQIYLVRADLCIANGLVLRQNRIVNPHPMRQGMLQRIHEGYLGMEKCKTRAREAVYWPDINKDIEEMIQKCETCLRHHYKQTKEPMLIADLPTAPWQKVATDLFHLHGEEYLLVIDYYSNYSEVLQLSSTSAQSVITHMKVFLPDTESYNVSSVTIFPNMTVVNSVSLQSNMDFKISPLAPCIHRQMDRLKKGSKLLRDC